MKRLREAMAALFLRLSVAGLRFPLTVFCLLCCTILTCYIISLHEPPGLLLEKLQFVFIFGAFLGVTAQFACERFSRVGRVRLAVYGISVLLTLGYYLIISPAPSIDYEVGARTFVAVFSMFCAFVWLPSFNGDTDFNSVALIHFKSALISVLYAGVLTAGLAAIIGAVDILLFDVSSDVYSYMMSIVWILFAPIYYLSLLPRFNSEEQTDRHYVLEYSQYPRFLEILVSYIAIPLVAAFTLVLISYFVKIGITRVWPTGHLGPMILGYSSAGLIIYILASRLENRFAVLYQRIFPKVLVPVVVMQLISVYIRLNAYGVTESRYYVALFGVFSIVIGIILSFKPVKRNGLIALLAAGFAVLSIIPPVDAFTISRNSQVTRLENMLEAAEVLVEGEIKADPEADMTLRLETTSILNYLERRNYLETVAWLPEDFQPHRDMEKVFGFEPTYEYLDMEKENFFFASLDTEEPLDIEGYDVMLLTGTYRGMDKENESVSHEFEIGGVPYRLTLERLSPQETRVSVWDDTGSQLVATGLYDFAASLAANRDQTTEAMEADELTLDVEDNGCKLRIIFQHLNIYYGSDEAPGADYNMYILFAAPDQGV